VSKAGEFWRLPYHDRIAIDYVQFRSLDATSWIRHHDDTSLLEMYQGHVGCWDIEILRKAAFIV
jgi:hypothetical protein